MVTARQAAMAMKRLSDERRDELIEAAGDKVVDKRAYFADRQKQQALALAYRRPTPKPRGGAA